MRLEFKTLFQIAQKLTSIRESGKNSVTPQELERLVDQIEPIEESPYELERYLIEEGVLFQLRDGWTGPVKSILIHKDAIQNVTSKHESDYAEMKSTADSAEALLTSPKIQYAKVERHGEGILFDFLKRLESKYPCGTKIPCTSLSKEWNHPSIKWAAVRSKVLKVMEIVDPSVAYVKYEYKLPYNWDALIESNGLSISSKVRFSHLKVGVTPSDDVVQVILRTLGTPISNVLKHLQDIGYTSSANELPKVINSWKNFSFRVFKDSVRVEAATINGYPALTWYRHKYLGVDLPSPDTPNTVIQAISGSPLKSPLLLKWNVVFTFNNGTKVYQLEFNKYDSSFDWNKLKQDLDSIELTCVGNKTGFDAEKSIVALKQLITLKCDQEALLNDI